ncbi:MAG: lipoprotein insertase outer membrane protein LolB, partial [Dokdonella sp.]
MVMSLLMLAGCAAQRLRPDQQLLGAQEQREAHLAKTADWSLNGRLAISGPDEGGSGSVLWIQRGDAYQFTLIAPVTGKTWTLSGDQDRSELAGVRAQPVHGASASQLLEAELGWQVPVAELRYWARGARAPGRSELVFRADGLPAELAQAGWKVEYLDYLDEGEPRLPRRVFMRNRARKFS